MRQDVLARGGLDKDLRRAVTGHELVRLRAGTFCDAPTWSAADDRKRHTLLARGTLRKACTDAVLSHVTAAAVMGAPLWGLPLDAVHLTRLDRRGGRSEAGVTQHRGLVRRSDVVVFDGLETTSPARTVIDLSCLPGLDLERALIVADDLLHRNLTTTDELRAGQEHADGWPHSRTTELVVRLADGRRESVGGSRTFFLMWRYGLPYAVPQVDVADEQGVHLGRVDFAWPELGVWLEFDGKQKYVEHLRPGESVVDAVLREKRRQERIERATGWRCIRITWADLQTPRATAAYISRVLAGAHVHH